MKSLSVGEKKYVVDGVAADIRADGRSRKDFRPISLQTNVVDSASGSALVSVGRTKVLCGVKVELSEPRAGKPDQGFVSCQVECCPSASPEFEGRKGEEANAALGQVVSRVLSGVELKALSIVKGEQCWALYVDAQVLDSDGSLLDVLSIAVRCALFDAKIPVVHVVTTPEGSTELEIDEDPLKSLRIRVHDIPVIVSITKIGKHWITDSTIDEEMCMIARVSFAVDYEGAICGVHKGGSGGFDPSALPKTLNSAKEAGKLLLNDIDRVLLEAESYNQQVRNLSLGELVG